MNSPNTLSLSREKMYQMVWAEPMTAIAAKLGVSGSYLARICTLMNVPRPERGYWAKLKAGKKCIQPPLPEARPCDVQKWQKGQPIPRQKADIPSIKTIPGSQSAQYGDSPFPAQC